MVADGSLDDADFIEPAIFGATRAQSPQRSEAVNAKCSIQGNAVSSSVNHCNNRYDRQYGFCPRSGAFVFYR